MNLRSAPRPRISGLRRWASSALAALALGATVVVAPACVGGGTALTAHEVDTHGIVVLRAPAERAFKASAEALKALGYELDVENPEKGLLVTKRRSLAGLPTDGAGASERAYFRQYTIEIKSGGGGTARVKATPAIFESETDISAKKVWDLESPTGERELWKQLFAKIEQLL